jgi:probable phosphoglycerate mutase
LLRHGRSTFNLQHRCQGSSDEPELTPQGREEARLSGERFALEGIHAVISSPLRRSAETAVEVLKAVGAQGCRILSEIDSRLCEIDLYYWEGRPLKEIPRLFGEQYQEWRMRPDTFSMRLTDNRVHYPVRDLYKRARYFWNYLLAVHSGKSVLLVTHGGTIRALISTALGLGPEHFHSFQQSNCGLSGLRFPWGSGSAKVDLLNDTAHLGEGLPKLKEGRRGVRLLFVPVTERKPTVLFGRAAALDGVVLEQVITVGETAHNVAGQIFPSYGDSSLAVSDAMAGSVADKMLHSFSEGEFRQVAILGAPDILRRMLEQQLRISHTAAESLNLRPFEITSVHHPANGVPPVLQSMNLSKPSPVLVGSTL